MALILTFYFNFYLITTKITFFIKSYASYGKSFGNTGFLEIIALNKSYLIK